MNSTTNSQSTSSPGCSATTTTSQSQSWYDTSTEDSNNFKDLSSASSAMALDLPELRGKSDILELHHIRELSKFLPPRAEGYAWTLAFTTTHMGFSLKSLYRSLSKYEGPVLLMIKDTEQIVFGAFCSCNLQPSESFYGTGETYLFTFKSQQDFIRFPWTGDNQYFIKGDTDSLVLGAGEGNFGLWLDEDLYHGTTHYCRTFNNAPLTNKEDFVVCTLECWCFL